MAAIQCVHQPAPEKLKELGVETWPIWEKEVSNFPWTYDQEEVCYFLEGEVTVTPDGGEAVTMGKGDLVTFSAGMSCTWDITKAVRKHYTFKS
ncbi:cupin domain-containing protein [Magnetococcales bacterium HHB-1]